jgi:hypothetical protein
MQRVEAYAADPATSNVMAMIASGFSFQSNTASRTQQAQNMRIDGYNDEFCFGIEACRKTPRLTDADRPMRFVCVYKGVSDSGACFERGQSVRPAGAMDVGAVYLDYRCSNGSRSADPRRADEICNAPMPSGRINHAIRIMLQEACGLTAHQVRRYTKHTPRHFLIACSQHRGEPSDRQVEIGKWFGSTLALRSMTPKQRRETKSAMAAARFPDLYSEQDELVKRVARIMLTQIQSCRRLIASTEKVTF